jgi:hypothetical protein
MTRIIAGLVLALVLLGAAAQAQTAGTTPTISVAAKDVKTFHALLAQYEGLATNLGKLIRVTDAFMIVEQEGVEMAVAMNAVASFQFIREVDEDAGVTKEFVEIQLFARD